MNGRTPTITERGWMSEIAGMGCCVCIREGLGATPAEIHHITGSRKPGCHLKTIPLCPRHHRIKSNDGQWVSRHVDGRRAFESRYGTEAELLEWCQARVAERATAVV